MSELSDAQAGLADAQQGWLIESPQVFGLYQAVEEGRLAEVKEILAKWETSRSDIARGEMEGSERVMMGILGWDTMEDLQEFLLKKGHVGGGGGGRQAPPQSNGNRNVSNASAMSGMSRAPSESASYSTRLDEVKLTSSSSCSLQPFVASLPSLPPEVPSEVEEETSTLPTRRQVSVLP